MYAAIPGTLARLTTLQAKYRDFPVFSAFKFIDDYKQSLQSEKWHFYPFEDKCGV